jgi:hypothetical protein
MRSYSRRIFQALFVQPFQIEQFVVGALGGADQLIKLDLDRGGIRVLTDRRQEGPRRSRRTGRLLGDQDEEAAQFQEARQTGSEVPA